MKRNHLLISLILCLVVLLMSGCGPSLKDFMTMSDNYSSAVSTSANAKVFIGDQAVKTNSGGIIGSIATTVNVASGVAGYAVAREQESRVRRLVGAKDVADILALGFNEGFGNRTHLTYTSDSRPDIRIMLTVKDFGMYAESLASKMIFYVDSEIQIVYGPTLETIYRSPIRAEREVGSVISEIMNMSNDAFQGLVASHAFMIHVAGLRQKMELVGNVVNIAAGIVSMQAFFDLTDEDLVCIYEYIAYDSGKEMADKLINAIYR